MLTRLDSASDLASTESIARCVELHPERKERKSSVNRARLSQSVRLSRDNWDARQTRSTRGVCGFGACPCTPRWSCLTCVGSFNARRSMFGGTLLVNLFELKRHDYDSYDRLAREWEVMNVEDRVTTEAVVELENRVIDALERL
jgi:hypothetical protein